jgi:hypothetical protein
VFPPEHDEASAAAMAQVTRHLLPLPRPGNRGSGTATVTSKGWLEVATFDGLGALPRTVSAPLSSNGRAAALQAEDGGSIPSRGTMSAGSSAAELSPDKRPTVVRLHPGGPFLVVVAQR